MNFWIYLVLAFILIDLILIVVVFVRRSRNKMSGFERANVLQHLQRIEAAVKQDPRYAIMEADKLVHKVLKKRLRSDSPFGEILKKQSSLFSDINNLWFAHKMRNKLAHELNYHINSKQALQALSYFKNALKDLGL